MHNDKLSELYQVETTKEAHFHHFKPVVLFCKNSPNDMKAFKKHSGGSLYLLVTISMNVFCCPLLLISGIAVNSFPVLPLGIARKEQKDWKKGTTYSNQPMPVIHLPPQK